jgi:hypothetical protein
MIPTGSSRGFTHVPYGSSLDRYAATDVNFVRVVDPHNGLWNRRKGPP